MTPFVLANYNDEDRNERTKAELLKKLLVDQDMAKQLLRKETYTAKELAVAIDKLMEEQHTLPVFINDKYQVILSKVANLPDNWPPMLNLSIRRLDREAIHDWRDLQAIKNEIIGPEHEGMEMFPAESRLVDSANQYYMWVFADRETRFPFGFRERYVTEDSLSTSKQRRFDGQG